MHDGIAEQACRRSPGHSRHYQHFDWWFCETRRSPVIRIPWEQRVAASGFSRNRINSGFSYPVEVECPTHLHRLVALCRIRPRIRLAHAKDWRYQEKSRDAYSDGVDGVVDFHCFQRQRAAGLQVRPWQRSQLPVRGLRRNPEDCQAVGCDTGANDRWASPASAEESARSSRNRTAQPRRRHWQDTLCRQPAEPDGSEIQHVALRRGQSATRGKVGIDRIEADVRPVTQAG